jgi:hypothetical protein
VPKTAALAGKPQLSTAALFQRPACKGMWPALCARARQGKAVRKTPDIPHGAAAALTDCSFTSIARMSSTHREIVSSGSPERRHMEAACECTLRQGAGFVQAGYGVRLIRLIS